VAATSCSTCSWSPASPVAKGDWPGCSGRTSTWPKP